MTEPPFRDMALASDIAAVQRIAGIKEMLAEVCMLTGMGFSAVARVTDTQWIACMVDDRIDFGLAPGEELELRTTICNEIRQHRGAVVIDNVGSDPGWRSHPTPILYGFQSYVSIPIIIDGDRFFGTLCAIDPEPCTVPLASVLPQLQAMANRIAKALSL